MRALTKKFGEGHGLKTFVLIAQSGSTRSLALKLVVVHWILPGKVSGHPEDP